jgi:hypothetical protein
MKDYPYIVKLRSIVNNNIVNYGTGFIVDSYTIITAKHVLQGNAFEIEFTANKIITATIEKFALDCIGILKTSTKMDISPCKLSLNYIPTLTDQWKCFGYITDTQNFHSLQGVGLCKYDDTMGISDIAFCDITVRQGNYKGMSGSPIFVDDMIVGIAQEQVLNSETSHNILATSVDSLKNILPIECFEENKNLKSLIHQAKLFSHNHVNDNIISHKYIPEIFVEEGDTKELLRYFTDPCLFIEKTYVELSKYDFTALNSFLKENNLKEVVINKLLEKPNLTNIKSFTKKLIDELIEIKKCLEMIDSLSKKLLEIGHNKFCMVEYFVKNNSFCFFIDDTIDRLNLILKNVVILTADAGQGKTNFLCDFSENYLMKKDYLVLYYNAYEFTQPPCNQIKEDLDKFYKGTHLFDHIQKYCQQINRPAIIVIDGLNENNVIKNFCLLMKNTLEDLTQKNVKFILSTRNEFYDDRFRELETSAIYESKRITLRHNGEEFKNRLFNGYIQHFNVGIRAETLFNSTYERLTSDILLLRFFCEAYKDQPGVYMYNLYKRPIFEQYKKIKTEEYKKKFIGFDTSLIFTPLINRIIKYMIENKSYKNIDMNIFEDASDKEKQLLHEILHNDVIFKSDINNTKGLVPTNKSVIDFTFDEFRDYCIVDYIVNNFEETQITKFLNEIDINSTIYEGVHRYLFAIAKAYPKYRLLSILQNNFNYEQIYWDNILQIEDKNISPDDITKIKNHCIEHTNTELTGEIIYDIIYRFDLEFYSNLNINVLFDILNDLSSDENSYMETIELWFEEEKEKNFYTTSGLCFPYNHLLKLLRNNFTNDNFIPLIKLTLYIYEINFLQTELLWCDIYSKNCDWFFKIISDMSKQSNIIFKQNLYYLLESLSQYEEISSEHKSKLSNIICNIENIQIIKRNIHDNDYDLIKIFLCFDDYEENNENN